MFAPRHADRILEFYNSPATAAQYARARYITACERLLFDRYIAPGASILDVGVGGGRTSEYLARGASRYVGIDYAVEMIQICRRKYPEWEYVAGSVTDLSRFQDGSFDAVVMPYNVVDDVIPAQNRWRCFKECYRVLRSGGYLIFSSHNPRAILARPDWEAARSRVAAKRAAAGEAGRLAFRIWEMCALADAAFLAIKTSALWILRYSMQAPFWRGEGHMLDSEGLMTHFWIPRKVIAELTQFAFRPIDMRGDDYPRKSRMLLTGWYYYVFAK